MYCDSNIKATAASICQLDIETFLNELQYWQQSLNRQRSYDDCVINTIDDVLNLFFDCCEYL